MTDVVTSSMQQLMNRVRMWMAGVSFGGQRDLYEQFGYKRILSSQDFIQVYYRQGLAKRVNDQPVLATWADPPKVSCDNQDFNDAWNEIVQTGALWHHLIRLDKIAGLGRFAIMVIGYDDGKPLDQPVVTKIGRKVMYMQPYHERAIGITQYETNRNSPRFGLPVMYTVNPVSSTLEGNTAPQTTALGGNVREPLAAFTVHWSRVVHVAEHMLEDRIFGIPRLEFVFNDLMDAMKVSGASAETFWLIANRGFQINVDKDMDISPQDADDLKQEIEDYQHQITRFIRTRGVEVNSLGHDQVDPQGVFNVVLSMISAATGIPQSMLVGGGNGRMSSAQDRANWSERIAERVCEYAQPVILKRTMDSFIGAGALPLPQNMQIEWPEAFKLNPLERSQTSASMARSAVNLMKAHQLAANNTQGITGQDASLGKSGVFDTGKGLTGAPGDASKGKAGTPQKPNMPNGSTSTVAIPQPVQQSVPMAEPLFDREEMRRMVSFGKHPPIFDNPIPSGAVPAPGENSNPSIGASTNG